MLNMNKIFAFVLSLAILLTPTMVLAHSVPEVMPIAESVEVTESEVKTLPYNFESVYRVPIKLSITEKITTKGQTLTEGQTIQFRVVKDTYCKRKTFLKKDNIVNAKIETVISPGMNGFPAEIIVGDFEIPGARPTQLVDTYVKKGQNRCYVVYPIKWALTIIPFVGSLTNLIMGGNAKIKPSDEVVIYYYPDWK